VHEVVGTEMAGALPSSRRGPRFFTGVGDLLEGKEGRSQPTEAPTAAGKWTTCLVRIGPEVDEVKAAGGTEGGQWDRCWHKAAIGRLRLLRWWGSRYPAPSA